MWRSSFGLIHRQCDFLTGSHTTPGSAFPAGKAGVESGESRTETGWIQEASVIEQCRRFAQREVLAVRMPYQVLGCQQFPQVGVVFEGDPEHVIHFTLHEVGGAKEVGDRR